MYVYVCIHIFFLFFINCQHWFSKTQEEVEHLQQSRPSICNQHEPNSTWVRRRVSQSVGVSVSLVIHHWAGFVLMFSPWKQTQGIKFFFKCIFLRNTPDLQVKMLPSCDANLLSSKSCISAQHRLSLVFQKPLRCEMVGPGLPALQGLVGGVWGRKKRALSFCCILV